MAYILDGTTIRRPNKIEVKNHTQVAQNRTLDGTISRDFFGSNKNTWIFSYENTNKTDFDIINTIYLAYLSTGATKSLQSTETNYTISATNVHVDLLEREFNVKGTDYISNFDLILTED